MVIGYQKSESLTANQKLIAGIVSGVTTRFITQPLDIVKLRTQLQSKGKSRTWLGLSWSIFKEEGIVAFWHGHSLGQLHSILSVSAQFHAYELSTRFVEQSGTTQTRPLLLFLCGIFAGCASAFLASPLEVIRVRQMLVKAQYGGVWQGAVMIYKTGGLRAFYAGLPASLCMMGPQVGISFAVFRFVQPLVLDFLVASSDCPEGECKNNERKVLKKDVFISSTVAGSTAGFVSKSMTYPFDLAKRRLQIATHKHDPNVKTPSTSRNLIKCTSLMSCLTDMVRKNGPTGLFRGWSITIYKAQLTSVVAFTTYEMICQILREYESNTKN